MLIANHNIYFLQLISWGSLLNFVAGCAPYFKTDEWKKKEAVWKDALAKCNGQLEDKSKRGDITNGTITIVQCRLEAKPITFLPGNKACQDILAARLYCYANCTDLMNKAGGQSLEKIKCPEFTVLGTGRDRDKDPKNLQTLCECTYKVDGKSKTDKTDKFVWSDVEDYFDRTVQSSCSKNDRVCPPEPRPPCYDVLCEFTDQGYRNSSCGYNDANGKWKIKMWSVPVFGKAPTAAVCNLGKGESSTFEKTVFFNLSYVISFDYALTGDAHLRATCSDGSAKYYSPSSHLQRGAMLCADGENKVQLTCSADTGEGTCVLTIIRILHKRCRVSGPGGPRKTTISHR